MYVGFRIRAINLDAMLPVLSIALVHPAKVLNSESPIAVRDGAPNDSGVFHWWILSREQLEQARAEWKLRHAET